MTLYGDCSSASLIQIHEPLGNPDSKDIKCIALLMVWRFLGKSIQQTLGGPTTLERQMDVRQSLVVLKKTQK